MQSSSTQTEVLIIGAGLAGTSLALSLPSTMKVTLLSSAPAPCGASPMALGGLAAVLSAQDSLEQHIEDTLEAGARHSDKEAVRGILQAAPEAVHWLLKKAGSSGQNGRWPIAPDSRGWAQPATHRTRGRCQWLRHHAGSPAPIDSSLSYPAAYKLPGIRPAPQ